MKASKHNDSNLIWESYNNKLSEGTDGSTDDLTVREKMKLAAHAAKKGKGPLAKEEDDEVNEASHDDGKCKESPDLHSLSNRARNDRHRGRNENDLEKEV